jgi:nucleoside-diphosphate-sugar epimerase
LKLAQFTVLGASGFIGGNVAGALAARGHDVLTPTRKELASLVGNLGHVIYAIGTDNYAKPWAAVEGHVWHLRRLFEQVQFETLTYISSSRLYLGAETAREDSKIVTDVSEPGFLFNSTKLAGEAICLSSSLPNVRVVRLSNVIGYAPRGINLIPTLIKSALKSGAMQIWINRQSAKDYVTLHDVLDVLPKIALRGRHRIYNLGSGANLTVANVAGRIEANTGATTNWAPGELIVFPPLSIERIRDEFDFQPRATLDALDATCREFKVQSAWKRFEHAGPRLGTASDNRSTA